MNTRFTEEEVAYVVEDSGASYHVRARRAAARGRAERDRGPRARRTSRRSSTRAARPAFPKGAMTSHANFLTNSENAFRCLSVERSEGPSISTLVSVPLFHVTGCNSQLIPVLEFGGRVEILSGPLDLDGLLRGGRRARRQPARVGAGDLPRGDAPPATSQSSTSAACAGSPTAARRSPRASSQQIKEAFPTARVGNGFGLTETSSLTSFLPHEEAAEHADSVGFAMPVVDLALDEADAESGVGELLVRGPNVVQGYWNKPRGDGRDVRGRLAAHRRSRAHRRRRPALHRRSQEGHDQPRRRERLLDRGRKRARGRARRRRGGGRRRCRTR